MEPSGGAEEMADCRKGSGRHLLTVDEEAVRPRANSDPTVRVGAFPFLLPEITVEDFTDPEQGGQLHHPHHQRQDGLDQQDEGGLFGAEATPRRRANTCPDDLFRRKSERPPTPPPGAFRKGPPARLGRSKGKAGPPSLCKSPVKEIVSFAHHRLTKLPESEAEESALGPATAAVRLTSPAARVKRASFSGFASERVELCAWPQPYPRDDATYCSEDKVVDLFPSLSKSFEERLGMSEADEEEEAVASHPSAEPDCPVTGCLQSPGSGVTRKKSFEKKDSGCCSCKTSPTTATSGEGRLRQEGEAGTRCHGCLADNAANCRGEVYQGFWGESGHQGSRESNNEGCDAELAEVREEDEEEAHGKTYTTTNSSKDSVVVPTPAPTPGAQCGWTQEPPARGLDTSQLQAC